MSLEINSKHQTSGAKKKGRKENKEVEIVETNVFDLAPEKPPARSTYLSHVKDLDNRIKATATTVPIFNNFDRLKLCVDLKLHASDIEFENISLVDIENPEKQKSFVEARIENYRLMKVAGMKSEPTIFSADSNSDLYDNPFDDLLEDYALKEQEEDLPVRKGNNIYPNCGVKQELLPMGLNAIYIKNDYFVIDFSGKWMAEAGCLGYINIHNIVQCLIKVRECKYVNFNVGKLIDVATVRICDVTLDLRTTIQNKFIKAMSAMYPTIAERFQMYNYKNDGMIIRSRAKDVGMSFCMYDKGRELSDKRHNFYSYLMAIGEEGSKLANEILRLEVHLWRLDDMREILELPVQKKYEVSLSDVLKSKSPAVLNVFKRYKLTEEILRDEIKGFTDEYLTSPQNEAQVTDLLAGMGVMSLFGSQAFNIRSLRDMLAVEFELEDDEKMLKKLNRIIRDSMENFILYNKPKSIKKVLELLDLIHQAYGRILGGEKVAA